MALHSKFICVLSLLTVALSSLAAAQIQFRPSSYTVRENEGYVVVEVCHRVDQSAMNDTGSSGMSMPVNVYITSEGQTASKLLLHIKHPYCALQVSCPVERVQLRHKCGQFRR